MPVAGFHHHGGESWCSRAQARAFKKSRALAAKGRGRAPWLIEQVAGRMNSRASDEICAVALKAMDRINAAPSPPSPAATP